MCAASVYPEPGSNSLVFISLCIFFLCEFCFFGLFFYFLFLISFLGSISLPFLLVFLQRIYCLLFNVLLRSYLSERFSLYYVLFSLSTSFCDFFSFYRKKYFPSLLPLFFSSFLFCSFSILSTFLLYVNIFSLVFFPFY
jgi:hypothetical protein